MFVSERLNEIINILNQEGKVEVNKLSILFDVSKDLIRKDLKKLEEQGVVDRTYGGATKKKHLADTAINVATRIIENTEIKQQIAYKALNILKENELIFLDISSINYLLAQKIIEKNLSITIITNMIDIMHLFSLNPDTITKLIAIGGKFNGKIGGFIGTSAIQQLNMFNIDKCFIGTLGLDIKNGNVSTFDQEDGLMKASAIKMSKEKILITDKTKIEQYGKFIFSNLNKFNLLLTNYKFSHNDKQKFQNYNLKII